MGEGLKRVAKQCGGLTVTARGKTARYDADGKRRDGNNKPTFGKAIEALLDACEFAMEVLGSEEMGPGSILDENAGQRFEAVLRLMHAMEMAKSLEVPA